MPLPTTLPPLNEDILLEARLGIFDRGFDALEIFNADRLLAPTPDASDAWVAFDMFASLAALDRLEDLSPEEVNLQGQLRETILQHKAILAPLVAALFKTIPGEWKEGADMRDKSSFADATLYLAALDDMELAHVTLDSLDCDLGLEACKQLAGTVARVLETPQDWTPASIYVRATAHLMRNNPEENPLLALTQHKFNVILKSLEEMGERDTSLPQ